MSWVCVSTEGRVHQSGNLPDEHVSWCGLCSSNIRVRYLWSPFQDSSPADETSRRFEWSSQRHARFRAASCSKLHRRESEADELSPWRADSHAVQQAKKGGTSTGSPQTQLPRKLLRRSAERPIGPSRSSRCNGDLHWMIAVNRCLRWWHRCLILTNHVRQVCPTG